MRPVPPNPVFTAPLTARSSPVPVPANPSICAHQQGALHLFGQLEQKRLAHIEKLKQHCLEAEDRIQKEETQHVVSFLKTAEGMEFLRARAAQLRTKKNSTKNGTEEMQARIVEELVEESQAEVKDKVSAEVARMRDLMLTELRRERAALLLELQRLDMEASCLPEPPAGYDEQAAERVRGAVLDLPTCEDIRKQTRRAARSSAQASSVSVSTAVASQPSRIPPPSVRIASSNMSAR
jgi:hypothetical protein